MSITPSEICKLVDVELTKISDGRVKNHILSLLVEPILYEGEWGYGVPGQTYPCWLVLNDLSSKYSIAYCEYGFGPSSPWGLVMLTGNTSFSIGMDSGWFPTFMEAYFDSWAATDLPIWRVFKQVDGRYPGTPLTEESDWDSTWDKVYKLRTEDPSSRYHCSHSITLK